MRRDQLEHLLRAAARITEERDVFVIGSQAILATFDDADLPPEVTDSIEADVHFRGDADNVKADLVDGVIGELSAFHGTFGVYAQGVGAETAVLPEGWEDRLVVLDTPSTEPGRGLCLEVHDLVASKLVAGREKDFDFAAALIRDGLIDAATVEERVGRLPVTEATREWIRGWLEARRSSRGVT